MYGQQQQRPLDIGQNSFQDFSNDLHNQTKNLRKSFKHLKDINQTKTIEQQQIPNLKYHSATWDSQHMDSFLKDEAWAQNQTISRNTNTASSRNTRSQKSLKNKSLNSTSKTSFFFNTVGRFKPNEDNYLVKDYENNYSQHNFIVVEKPTNHEMAKQYFDRRFEQKSQSFQKDKLDFTKQPVRLQSPSQNRRQLELTKEEQKQYSQWKQNHMELTKQLRVHKSEYKSGIMNVDDPYNQDSQIYKDEAKKIKIRQTHSSQINKRFKQQVAQRTQTNQQIEFYNKKYNRQFNIDHKHEKLNPIWNNKKRVETPTVEVNYQTQERLFGGPIETEYSMKRAQYLKSQDQRNRDYDFITLSKSHLDGFQDYYKLSHKKFLQNQQQEQEKKVKSTQQISSQIF